MESKEKGTSHPGLEWLAIIGSVIFALIAIAVAAWWWLRPKLPVRTPLVIEPFQTKVEAGSPSQSAASVLYASPDGTGRGCGKWQDACDLQVALSRARPGQEIWVQAGLYKPAPAKSSLESTFQLKSGVALYGGFAGSETARDQRDWKAHLTVLSGDLGGDDTTDANGVVTDADKIVGQNVYHVVVAWGVDASAVLDGFVITAGYANMTPPNIHGYGGGVFNWTASPTLSNLVISGNTAGKGAAYYAGGGMLNIHSSNPALTHVTFTGNTAGSGGGMYNDNSNPTLTDAVFKGNRAIDGSCMSNTQGSRAVLSEVLFEGNTSSNKGCLDNEKSSNAKLANVTFSRNKAKYGAGMYNYQSSPTLTKVIFSDNVSSFVAGGMNNSGQSNPSLTDVYFFHNSAQSEGAGMANYEDSNPTLTNVAFVNNSASDACGGGIINYDSSPVLTNVTFSGNHGTNGGGMSSSHSNPSLTNVTFADNTSHGPGSALYNVGGSKPTVTNTILWDNAPLDAQLYDENGVSIISYSIIPGRHRGEGNLEVDPQLDKLANNGGFVPSYALLSGSPAIDAGSPSACPSTDQLGLPRPLDGDGDGSVGCDMGAFEYRPPE